MNEQGKTPQVPPAGKAPWAPTIICLFFVLIGALLFFLISVPFASRSLSARSWVEIPATIISSTVGRHPGETTTYSIDVRYRYEFQNRSYISDQYDLLGGSSSGSDSKRAIVNKLKAGTVTTAYVNPADPSQAVLDRKLGWLGAIAIGFPFPFLIVGIAGAVATRRAPKMQPALAASSAETGKITNRFAVFGFMLIFSLLWNGFVWWQLISSTRRHGLLTFDTLFMVPFAIVGLVGLVITVFIFMSAFHPTMKFTLSQTPWHLGESVTVSWIYTGRFDRVQRLHIVLEGRERTFFQRKGHMDSIARTFITLDLFDTTKPIEIARGKVSFRIPQDSVISTQEPNKAIDWYLVARGEIPHWTNAEDEHAVTILPAT